MGDRCSTFCCSLKVMCLLHLAITKAKLHFSCLAAFNVSKLLFELQNRCFLFYSASPHPCLSAYLMVGLKDTCCSRTTGVLPSRDNAVLDAMQRLVRVSACLDLFIISF